MVDKKMRPVVLDERSVKFWGYAPGKVSAEMPLFYNPAMCINRDIGVAFLKAWGEKKLQVCDLLSGTGIRSLRLTKECGDQISHIDANDGAPSFIASMKKNLKQNKIPSKKINLSCSEASQFLLQSTGYDYIEVDPFGSPNPFLDAAIRRLSRRGVLAVTATDTSALCGTYLSACRRKYWAEPLRGVWMHEVGLRILIRKVQLVASQFERGLRPVLSYSDQHYMRVYFMADKRKAAADEMLRQHGSWRGAGPMWLGPLWDEALLSRCKVPGEWSPAHRLIDILKKESKIPVVGFHDIHDLASRHKRSSLPRMDVILEGIRKLGFKAERTHFSDVGIRTDAPESVVVRLIGA